MQAIAEPIQRLIDAFTRLPGVGPKSASRLAFYLLRAPREQVNELAAAIGELREAVVYCSRCQNLSTTDPCSLCADETRDPTLICVVEEPLDVVAVERTGAYHGLYHGWRGAINPVEGISPDDLRIEALLRRLKNKPVREIIVATNPNMEGEATAMYLARLLRGNNLRITRLARGLPVGGDLEYTDEVTLSRALEGRSEL